MSIDAHRGLPRLLAGIDPGGAPMTLAEHERIHGPLPRPSSHELIESIELSGLRGRGGADFPTARKLRAVAGGAGALGGAGAASAGAAGGGVRRRRGLGRGRPSAVVVNGSETEPASAKDALLLSRLPHLVLDGAVLCALAVGAEEVIVKVGENARESLQSLEAAARVREDKLPIQVYAAPEGYVAGEESAVMHYLNRGEQLPTFVPPRPFERGYRGRPTLVQNPETLAQVALVARFGPHWYRELGTAADPGSALVTISGAVRAPGVYELAFGTSMIDLVEAAGGATEPLQALLIGGYFGTWVDSARALEVRLAREDLRSIGASLGSGVLIALGQSSCGLHESARVIEYLAAASAGQCGPCVYGLAAVARSVARDGLRRSGSGGARARPSLDLGDPGAGSMPPPRWGGSVRREHDHGVRARDRAPS